MAKKTVKAEIMMDSELSSRINLNLNQDDLIQMVIEERSSHLEEQINLKEEEITKLISDYKQKLLEFSKTMLKFEDTEIYKRFKAIANEMNSSVNISTPYIKTYNEFSITKDNEESNMIIYKNNSYHNNWKEAEESKQPISQFSRYSNKYCLEPISLSEIKYELSASERGPENSCNCNIILSTELRHTLNDNEKLQINEFITSFLQVLAKCKNDSWNLKKSYFDIKYGAGKLKAQITKASLQKSSNGQALLTMLEQATNIKFLS